MQQFTHPVHPKSSYPFVPASVAKRKKYEIRAVDKKIANGKKQSKAKTVQRTEYTGKQFSFQKLIASQQPPPIKYLVACAAQFPKLSSLAAAASS